MLEQNKRKRVKETQEAVIEESPPTPVRMGKRVREASQLVSEPLEKSVCKSTINKPKRKVIDKESEIKNSLKLSTKDKTGSRTSELTEDANKKVDSPKVVPCKENEGANNQQVSFTLIWEEIKEEKPKGP